MNVLWPQTRIIPSAAVVANLSTILFDDGRIVFDEVIHAYDLRRRFVGAVSVYRDGVFVFDSNNNLRRIPSLPSGVQALICHGDFTIACGPACGLLIVDEKDQLVLKLRFITGLKRCGREHLIGVTACASKLCVISLIDFSVKELSIANVWGVLSSASDKSSLWVGDGEGRLLAVNGGKLFEVGVKRDFGAYMDLSYDEAKKKLYGLRFGDEFHLMGIELNGGKVCEYLIRKIEGYHGDWALFSDGLLCECIDGVLKCEVL